MARYISKYGNEVVNTDDKAKGERLIDLGFELVSDETEKTAKKTEAKKADK